MLQWGKWLAALEAKDQLRLVERLVTTKEGLERIVALKVRESDYVEFKLDYNRRDPRWTEELRADCASLATAGLGFLIVGVDESRDGRDEAASLLGIDDALSLKDAIEDNLGNGLSPPIEKREVTCVPVTPGKEVVVVRVEGLRHFPIEIIDRRDRKRYVVREAGAKRWLDSEQALARRERYWARKFQVRGVVASIALSLVVGVGVVLWFFQREEAGRSRAVDPDLCANIRWMSASLSDDEEYVNDVLTSLGRAVDSGDQQACLQAHAGLVERYPNHPGRHYIRGQCLLLGKDELAAQKAFRLSLELAGLASAQRPGRTCLLILGAMSAYYAGNQTQSCDAWRRVAEADAAGDAIRLNYLMVARPEELTKLQRGDLLDCSAAKPALEKVQRLIAEAIKQRPQ